MAYVYNQLAHDRNPAPEAVRETLRNLEQARILLTAPANSKEYDESIKVELIQNTWLTGAAIVNRNRFSEEDSPEDAREYFNRAIELIGQLPEEKRKTPTLKLIEAQIYGTLWTIMFRDGNTDEAMRLRDRAIEILEELNNTYPENHEYRTNLLVTLLMPPTGYDRAIMFGEPLPESLMVYSDRLRSDLDYAIGEIDKYYEQSPDIHSYMMLKLISGLQAGDMDYFDGKYADATSSYSGSLGVMDEMAGKNPEMRPPPVPLKLILNLRLANSYVGQYRSEVVNGDAVAGGKSLAQAETVMRQARHQVDELSDRRA